MRQAAQLTFDFVPVMDRQLADSRRQQEIQHKRSIQDSWLQSAVERLPPTSEEWGIILMGIRLCRHVHDSECQRCKLGPYNHCPDALGTYWDPLYRTHNPIKVCLKDYIRWLVQHGLKSWVKGALR